MGTLGGWTRCKLQAPLPPQVGAPNCMMVIIVTAAIGAVVWVVVMHGTTLCQRRTCVLWQQVLPWLATVQRRPAGPLHRLRHARLLSATRTATQSMPAGCKSTPEHAGGHVNQELVYWLQLPLRM